MSEKSKLRVVFLCTHNSARSQMAEALLREDWSEEGPGVEAFSAGVEARGVHPMASQALASAGIDIQGLFSKTVEDLRSSAGKRTSGRSDIHPPEDHPSALFDVVVTVCDNAREVCPYLPGRKLNLHYRFLDPSSVEGSDQERLEVFCGVRDQIRRWLAEVVPEWIKL